MVGVTDSITVQVPPHLIPVETALGTLSMAMTTSPLQVPVVLNPCAYVMLGSWSAEAPALMWVTFRIRPGDDAADQLVREVHAVWAHPSLRGVREPNAPTIPVAVGQWLFATGALTHHSPDRTDQGDRWAHAVGGVIPERDQRATAADAEAQGEAVLEVLNRAFYRYQKS